MSWAPRLSCRAEAHNLPYRPSKGHRPGLPFQPCPKTTSRQQQVSSALRSIEPRSASSADRGSTPSLRVPMPYRSRPRSVRRANHHKSAKWPAGGSPSFPGTVVITNSPRIRSTTGPTCGLYGRSESARFSAPAPSALRVEWGPGTLVVPDQIIDRTWGRRHTVFSEVGPVVHIPFADPYCPRGRSVSSAEAARSVGRLNLVEPWP